MWNEDSKRLDALHPPLFFSFWKVAVNFHDWNGDLTALFKLHAGDDAGAVRSMDSELCTLLTCLYIYVCMYADSMQRRVLHLLESALEHCLQTYLLLRNIYVYI